MTDKVMIERVARAIYRAEARAARYSQDQIDAWEQYPQSVRDKWAATARAAIEAMREPTDEMLDDGGQLIYRREYAEDAWRAMIAAALKPETTT